MEFKILEKKRLFSEFFKIDRVKLKVETFDSGNLIEIRRYHLARPEVVALILENTSTNSIVMVEQFRYSTIERSHNNGWCLEIVGGILDEGEKPVDCARRETLEETGYKVAEIKALTSYYASVGFSNELVHLFYGTVTSKDKIEKGGGLLHESEDLKVQEIPFAKLMKMVQSGVIDDSKTIIALQWLALTK